MFLKHGISILGQFLNDHVTGVMAAENLNLF